MKKFLFLAASMLFVFTACDEPEPVTPDDGGTTVEAPVFSRVSASSVAVGFEGDEVVISYNLENPVEGGEVTATPAADWCTDFNHDATNRTVTFTVSLNDGEARSCEVEVRYDYVLNNRSEYQAFTVDISQSAQGEPTLNITTADLNFTHEGGEATVNYTILDPREDGQISASVEGDWCTDFNLETEGTVTFKVAANDGEAREDVLTLTYTYDGDKTKTATLNISQDELPPLPDPVLTLTSDAEVEVAPAGDTVEVTFTLENPREDGVFTTSTGDATWCTEVTVDEETSTVSFVAAANSTAMFVFPSARQAQLTVTYTYDTDKTVSFNVDLNQGPNYAVEYTMTQISGDYYGDDKSQQAGQMLYQLFLMNTEADPYTEGTANLFVALVCEGPTDTTAIAPNVGEYNMTAAQGSTDTNPFTISKASDRSGTGYYTIFYDYPTGATRYTRHQYTFGKATVSQSDGGDYVLDILLMNMSGAWHHFTYTGPISLTDSRVEPEPEPTGISLLTEDLTIEWPYARMNGMGYYWGNGRFTFEIQDQYTYVSVLKFEVYGPTSSDPAAGLPEGDYTINDTAAEWTVLAGTLNETTPLLGGSWVYEYGKSGTGIYNGKCGPLSSGTLKVTKNEAGGTVLTLNAEDDSGHTITATATVQINQYSFYAI